ncbi:ATP-binding cassette domain-containing protein [Mycobacterium sp.]|uniref:ABC transporter ATP-binding protein n=1 Tax=Mycobacterium sp. TaxID=1785 RepID=UPI0025CB7A5D|nr:ATP-binding cassette domain-containing protein [Mycobacterium sp.]
MQTASDHEAISLPASGALRDSSAEGFDLQDITVTRGRATLLSHVSASIPAGWCTAVTGASGAGKSTLLRLLNRLAEPTSGRITLDGVPIGELDVLALRRHVGLIAQTPVLLTDNVVDEVRAGRHELSEFMVEQLLTRVGLGSGFMPRATADLSGGEVQRLCLARALAVEPDVLLLDEPTSALDGASAEVISGLIVDHVTEGGTVVLVSHDRDLIARVATQVLFLDSGRIVSTRSAGR